MVTTLYLIRHGATEANIVQPYRLQGRRSNAPLAPQGLEQAEATCDALAKISIDWFYSSPLKRAAQTAKIIATAHARPVQILHPLAECDVGLWEGLTWDTIRENYAEAYQHFLENPAVHGYPEGETFAEVAERVLPVFEHLLQHHEGETILVAGHHIVNRIYLAALTGLPIAQARQVKLDNCGISIVERKGGVTRLVKLNSTEHLHQAIEVA